jgi:hypothetical protein
MKLVKITGVSEELHAPFFWVEVMEKWRRRIYTGI